MNFSRKDKTEQKTYHNKQIKVETYNLVALTNFIHKTAPFHEKENFKTKTICPTSKLIPTEKE